LQLIRIRASQLNGCAFCTDMHSVDARRAGRVNGVCMRLRCGATAAFSIPASAPRWPGPRR
jgi:alkylhydroperoxidase family enzyme